MEEFKEVITVTDKHGFNHLVNVEHQPWNGFSTAYYNGTIIGQREAWKLHEPIGDNDTDWERYEETFAEWRDHVMSDLIRRCEEYFNN